MMSSAHQMWDVPEVVENVLAFLPMRDLLLDQRVCIQWRDLIHDAPRLQEALFFKSVPTRRIGKDTMTACTREFNSLLENVFPLWFSSPLDLRYGGHDIDHLRWATTVARLAILRSDASWRRMLTAQPPFTVWEEAHGRTVYGGSSLQTGSMEVVDGLRMGLVYDRTELKIGTAQGFYMISDGVLLPALANAQDESSAQGHEPDSSNNNNNNNEANGGRIFAGEGMLTLVTRTHRGCTGPSKWAPPNRPFSSAGAEHVEIEMKSVPKGGRYNWWTKDGYYKRQRV